MALAITSLYPPSNGRSRPVNIGYDIRNIAVQEDIVHCISIPRSWAIPSIPQKSDRSGAVGKEPVGPCHGMFSNRHRDMEPAGRESPWEVWGIVCLGGIAKSIAL